MVEKIALLVRTVELVQLTFAEVNDCVFYISAFNNRDQHV